MSPGYPFNLCIVVQPRHLTPHASRVCCPLGSIFTTAHRFRISHDSCLTALTVVRLKAELKTRGLKQSGKKADLVHLLADAPGVLMPSPPLPPAPPAPRDDVLSDEEVARWMEEDTAQPPRPSRTSTKNASSKKQRKNVGSIPSPAVVAEEVLGGLPAARTFSSSRLGSAAAAKELIKDAELASPAHAAGEGLMASGEMEGKNVSRDRESIEEGASSSSPSGDGVGDDLVAGKTKNKRPPRKNIGAPTMPPPPQLPGPTEDMRKKVVIMDLLDRRETTFEREEGLESALVPRSDVYVVSTKKALRPWDGPHADRAETHVVVLLTDVFGYGDSFTRSTADEIAEICDAIVVVPDMFRKRPWTHEQPEEEYEAWRASHDPVGGSARRLIVSQSVLPVRKYFFFSREEQRLHSAELLLLLAMVNPRALVCCALDIYVYICFSLGRFCMIWEPCVRWHTKTVTVLFFSSRP